MPYSFGMDTKKPPLHPVFRGRATITTFGRYLQERCITTKSLAHTLKCSVSTVRGWRSGNAKPSFWAMPAIAKALGITEAEVQTMLGGAE